MHVLRVRASRPGLMEITTDVRRWVDQQPTHDGLLTLFCRHTSASLLIQENAAPAVRRDLEKFFDDLAPEGAGLYEHDDEGPDDMPAHLKTAMTQVQISVPVIVSHDCLARDESYILQCATPASSGATVCAIVMRDSRR